ncbi:MAG: hypothetical protein HUN04_04495 [Desulfobacter sp.]|nr:MAG: hypothetical protein HUN04_04495 [Desulfobacter sp.]
MFEDIFPDWFEIGVLGGLSEELAEDELERRRIEAEYEADQEPNDDSI